MAEAVLRAPMASDGASTTRLGFICLQR